ncbi:MAG: YbaB/EbfC family nucleoid-associated protein [Candidatus Marinimicrobia bacterium]|nr:YbaB/EbfC family nucleoid-associated protein [Candidatus Neomarinimicrobiota bacterium]
MFNKGNMTNILKQAQEVQKRIESVQNELEDLIIDAEAGGGLVKVQVNGKQELLELKIQPKALEEDLEMLEDLVISAVNMGLRKSLEESQNRMNSATGGMLGGMKIPGM